MAVRYDDQDEEERELVMSLLQSKSEHDQPLTRKDKRKIRKDAKVFAHERAYFCSLFF